MVAFLSSDHFEDFKLTYPNSYYKLPVTRFTARRNKYLFEEAYFKTTSKIIEQLSELPNAIKNTIEISDKCVQYSIKRKFTFPNSDSSNLSLSSMDLLRAKVLERFPLLYEETSKKVVLDRVNYELECVEKTNSADYFLLIADLASYLKDCM